MISELDWPFVEGDLVKILAGPFSGLTGKIGSISEDQRILKVILQFFGQKRAIELFLMDVEKVA